MSRILIALPTVQLRRVKVSEIWDKSTSVLSFSSLMHVASGYVLPKGKDGEALEAFIAKAKVTYIDEDGDNITMTSDAELEEAFLQTVKKFPACTPFRITVTVPRGRSQVYATPRFCGMGAGGQGPVVVRCMPWGDIRQSKEGDASPAAAEGEPEAPSGPPLPKFEDDLFVHARHTCDGCNKSPIVGTRHRATKIPNFDLCGACFEKYEGDKDLDFKPEIDGMWMCVTCLIRTITCSHHFQHASSPQRLRSPHAADVADGAPWRVDQVIRRSLLCSQASEGVR